MLAHRLRHRVAIQEKQQTRDDITGAVDYSWQTVRLASGQLLGAVPAEVLTGPGREVHAADTKLAETAARINLRWFPGLRHDMRILWDGRVFDILSIETDATARREYRLRCKDGLTDGT